jgi:hypothetical protein
MYSSRSNRTLSDWRAAADCIARQIGSSASCQGFARSCFSSRERRPFGVPTRYCTGGSHSRISASTVPVGMPRSITQTRHARPFCRSILAEHPQRRAIRRVAGQYLVGQRQATRSDHQCDHHPRAVQRLVPAHMGILPQQLSTHGANTFSGCPVALQIRGLNLLYDPRSLPCCRARVQLTYGRRASRRNYNPACDGQGSGGRDQSVARLFRPCREAGRPPGSAETDQKCSLSRA